MTPPDALPAAGSGTTRGGAATHTVVIPTLALGERAASLRRAIASARAGNQAAIDVVVVVNGQRFDPRLVDEVRTMAGVRVVQRPQPGSPGAILAGRLAVTTPFFSFLDDDDEYLPGAVDARIEVFEREPDVDVVAANGYRRRDGNDVRALKNLANVPRDPLRALFDENWLASCGASFRSSTVPAEAFERLPRHIHWTFLAFTLAVAGKRVAVVDAPAFVIHDTPGSASKQESYLLCHIEVYQRMLDAAPPPPIRAIVAARLAGALHQASDHFRRAGRSAAAWRMHLRSLTRPGGWRYLAYTRRLLFARPRSGP